MELEKSRAYLRILESVKDKQRILDLGCGKGLLVFFLAKQLKDAHVVGIDKDGSKFPNPKQVVGPGVASRVRFFEDDASNLGFQSDSFDAVVSTYALHEFEHPQRCLDEAFRVLDKKGMIALVDYIKETEAPADERHFTSTSIKTMISKSGFKQVNFEPLTKRGPGLFIRRKK